MVDGVFEKIISDVFDEGLSSDGLQKGVIATKPGEVDQSFEWLLSGYSDDIWRLKPNIKSDEPSNYIVNWFYDDQEPMSGWNYWVEVCKDVCVAKMGREGKAKLKTSSLAGYARNLRGLARFLYVQRKCSLVEDVSPDDIDAYKQSVISRDLSVSTLESMAIPLHDLYLLRNTIKQPLKFNPFCLITKSSGLKRMGRQTSIQKRWFLEKFSSC